MRGAPDLRNRFYRSLAWLYSYLQVLPQIRNLVRIPFEALENRDLLFELDCGVSLNPLDQQPQSKIYSSSWSPYIDFTLSLCLAFNRSGNLLPQSESIPIAGKSSGKEKSRECDDKSGSVCGDVAGWYFSSYRGLADPKLRAQAEVTRCQASRPPVGDAQWVRHCPGSHRDRGGARPHRTLRPDSGGKARARCCHRTCGNHLDCSHLPGAPSAIGRSQHDAFSHGAVRHSRPHSVGARPGQSRLTKACHAL
jgi:hypothetical protein